MLITSNKSYKGKENPKQSSMLSARLKEERVISTTTQPCPQWSTPPLCMGHRKNIFALKKYLLHNFQVTVLTSKWGGMSPEIHIWWHSKVVRSRMEAMAPKSIAETAYYSMTPLCRPECSPAWSVSIERTSGGGHRSSSQQQLRHSPLAAFA